MVSLLVAITAAQLLGFCTASDEVSAANCSAYIIGVAEAGSRSVCLPSDGTYALLVTEFVSKAEADAPVQMPAAAYLRAQWADSHPCP